MLYGRKTWYLRENEIAILMRTEKAMMRAMCGVKLIEKRSQRTYGLLALKDTLDGLARPSWLQWYEHVLRRDDDVGIKRVLEKRGCGQQNMAWTR